MKIIILLIIVIWLTGCDVTEELPYGYTYVGESKLNQYILAPSLHNHKQEDTSVPCSIKDYAYDDNYVIAKINFFFNDDRETCHIGFNESKYLEQGKEYFYIIDMKHHKRYGAFDTKEKLYLKLKKMNINLILK